MSIDKEREAFEHEMRCEEEWGHVSLTKDKHGTYRNHNTEKLWSVWKVRAAASRASLEAVPDGWVKVTQELLNSQEPWLYKPCWVAFPNGEVLHGHYEWRQGHKPDRFCILGGGDVWAFDASHVMPFLKPPHPSEAMLSAAPAQPAQQERQPMTEEQVSEKCLEWHEEGVRINTVDAYKAGVTDAERHHGIRKE